jgi:hypothetical protein
LLKKSYYLLSNFLLLQILLKNLILCFRLSWW